MRRVFALDEYGGELADSVRPASDQELRGLSSQQARDRPIALFLTANPDGSTALKLQREMQDIRDRLRETRHGRELDVEYEPAAQFLDLAFYVADARPTLIHFSGHGLVDGIALEDERGAARIVSNDALWRLFAQPDITENLRCVVLNSCYSQAQAMAIVQNVECVVGMSSRVPDDTARAFSRGFYSALGTGLAVAAAFELALAQLAIESTPGIEIPVLLVKPGVDARSVFIVGGGAGRAERVEIAPEPAQQTAVRLERVADKHWRGRAMVSADVPALLDAADQALRRLGAKKIEQRGPHLIVARTGGLFGGFDGTEEVTIALVPNDRETAMTIESRTRQLTASDFGNNEANLRQLFSLLGLDVQ